LKWLYSSIESLITEIPDLRNSSDPGLPGVADARERVTGFK